MNTQAESHEQHISRQFNMELGDIKKLTLEMGGAVEKQLENAARAMVDGDSALAQAVIDKDDGIDGRELKIDEYCHSILALRQPAASDLRLVLAIIKTVRDLERIGDESAKIAHTALKLAEDGDVKHGFVEFRQISAMAGKMVNTALDAFVRHDAALALAVAREDSELDQAYGSALRSLTTYMIEDPRNITRILNLLWALRALERIGDHAKNIAEHVIYLVKGMDIRHGNLDDVVDKIAPGKP